MDDAPHQTGSAAMSTRSARLHALAWQVLGAIAVCGTLGGFVLLGVTMALRKLVY